MVKNEELLRTILNDLHDDYQLGLHSISSLQHLRLCSNPNFKYRKKYSLMKNYGDNPIATNIMERGLNFFPYRNDGVARTVMFLGNVIFGNLVDYKFAKSISDQKLDYIFWPDNLEEMCNVIVAIPNYLEFNNDTFYVGDMNQTFSLGNMLLDGVLPTEFIYGYYERSGGKSDGNDKNLVLNDKHISKLLAEDRKRFVEKLIYSSPYYGRIKVVIKSIDDINKHLLIQSASGSNQYQLLKKSFKIR